MKLLSLIICAILIVKNLSAQNTQNSQLINLNLAEAFSRQQEVPLSRFVDKITYVPLETNPQAMIGGLVYYEVTDEYVIVRQIRLDRKSQILLFDRNTGKFIREIGVQGRGPEEFSNFSNIPFNSVKNELYAQSVSREILSYDISGKDIDKINTRTSKIEDGTGGIIDLSTNLILFTNMLDENIFAGYVLNRSGLENKKIILLSKEGVIKIFPNHLTWNKPGNSLMGAPGGLSKFYKWDNKLNFIETFCDTLYYVTKDKLIPRYFFDWGKYKVSYSKQGEISMSPSLLDNYFFTSDIDENNKYIFIKVVHEGKNYLGFIDKKTNSITFCKTNKSENSGFNDDIDNLMNVIPNDFTRKNEMIYVIQPAILISWLRENPDKATQAMNKMPWLKDINEFSNPIIAIGKCQE